ncbi:UpxY family transcription antiterminator [Bacteroides acidifaciens]|uniref:UpxY family transcription antiterminator n=1 Tax=Bacteroides acidifaciens TaxID=85831 RepID=UPI002583D344|nr:UpxY family transcription antiterminator [Bacteroides acidifaciens]
METVPKDILQWFAMRATFCRELTAKELLEAESVETFIPMHYETHLVNGRKKKILTPVVHNLIFVHTTKEIIQRIKTGIPYLQYITTPHDRRNVPIIVPEKQMQQFIAVSGTYDEQLLYLQPEELNLAQGTKVRIHGGAFDGQEGVFMKIKGRRNRRLVIAIQGVIAVATVVVHPRLIEVLP